MLADPDFHCVPSSNRSGLVPSTVPIDQKPTGVLKDAGDAPMMSREKSSTIGACCAKT